MSTPSTPGGTGTQTWPTPPTGSEAQPNGSSQDKKEQAKQVAGTAADEAKQTAGTAKDEARNVAATAKDEARNVMAEGKQQAAGLLDEARTQVDDQARTQRDRLVGTLRSFGDDLERMANGEPTGGGMAQDLARQVADRAREISGRVDGREPSELLDELRSFARRRPGTFLLGAVAAGVVAGRLTRGAKDAQSSGTTTASRTPLYDDVRATVPPAGGTAAGDPIAGTGYPETTPTYPAGSAVGEPGTTMDQPGAAGSAGTTPTADNPWAGDANRGGAL